jgi:inosine-uridine nucleoside N-ribohydrolase
MKKVIIDTDPGIDDAAAILFALASQNVSIEALTTVYGNGTIHNCTRNALTLMETAARVDIPVYKGAGKPLMREPRIGSMVHGEDAFGDVNIPAPKGKIQENIAASELISRILKNPGEITLIALGPLTNVALALSIEPAIAGAIFELIVMGGAVKSSGNASEVATANLYNDPEAAAIVYQSGASIVQVGLDVCNNVLVSEKQLAQISQAKKPTSDLLSQITPTIKNFYIARGNIQPGTGVQYNDMPAVGYVIDSSLFEIEESSVRISYLDEITKGQTVADIRNRWGNPKNTKILMDVDASRLTELFTDHLVNTIQ